MSIPLLVVAALGVPLVLGDVLHNDDVIIDGSLAVGTDAVDGEVFDFDTIRLKEDVLRIHFDDTSLGLGPSNDWRMVANDPNEGGDSYFGIEDATAGEMPFRVHDGAVTDSLVVATGGSVGLSTAAPEAAFHTALSFDDMLPARSALIGPDDLAPAGALLQVHGPFYLSSPEGNDLTIDPVSDARLYVEGGALFSGNLEIASSRTLKESIRSLKTEECAAMLGALRPVEYRYRKETEPQVGFVAEELPDGVSTRSGKSLAPMDLIAVLTAVVRDQQAKIDAREEQLNELRIAVERLQAKRRAESGNAESEPAAGISPNHSTRTESHEDQRN